MGNHRAAVLLLVLTSSLGLAACGDSGSHAERTATNSAPAETVPNPAPPGRAHNGEEYKGAYADAKEICGVSNRRKVAQITGSRSTQSEAIARAVAKGYKPRLRKRAYSGCLAGL